MGELIALAAQYRGTFLLVFVRLGAMLAVAPVLGHRSLPMMHRAGLAVVLALVLAPVVGPARGARLDEGLGLTLALAGEVFVGVVIGFVASLAVAAVQSAAELVGFQMGLGMGAVFDPAMGQPATSLTRFQEVVALLLFLGINGHHALLLTVAASFQAIAPGSVLAYSGVAAGFSSLGGKLFRSSLELAAPLVGILFIVNVVMALFTRVAPQMNVFALGAPVMVAVGLFGLVETSPYFMTVVGRLFGELGGDLRTVFAGVSGGF